MPSNPDNSWFRTALAILLLSCISKPVSSRPPDSVTISCSPATGPVVDTCLWVTAEQNGPTLCGASAVIGPSSSLWKLDQRFYSENGLAGVTCVGGDIYGRVETRCSVIRANHVTGQMHNSTSNFHGPASTIEITRESKIRIHLQSGIFIQGLQPLSTLETIDCDVWATGLMTVQTQPPGPDLSLATLSALNNDVEFWSLEANNIGTSIDSVLFVTTVGDDLECQIVPLMPGEGLRVIAIAEVDRGFFAIIPISGQNHELHTLASIDRLGHGSIPSERMLEAPGECWRVKQGVDPSQIHYTCRTGTGLTVVDGEPYTGLVEFSCPLKSFPEPYFPV